MKAINVFNLLILSGLCFFMPLQADECKECKEPCQCPCHKQERRYNPYCRYYPYCTIYQDSCVYEELGDDPASSWPSRKDGNFISELSR